jgi:hypothetical protein
MRNFPPRSPAAAFIPWSSRSMRHGSASPAAGPHALSCGHGGSLYRLRQSRRVAAGARHSPRREISVRLALGASGAAVLRQSLVEALLLSISGGLLGLALASVALRVGVSFLPETLPRVSSIGLDWQVVAFALGLAVLTGLLCGLIPALPPRAPESTKL